MTSQTKFIKPDNKTPTFWKQSQNSNPTKKQAANMAKRIDSDAETIRKLRYKLGRYEAAKKKGVKVSMVTDLETKRFNALQLRFKKLKENQEEEQQKFAKLKSEADKLYKEQIELIKQFKKLQTKYDALQKKR